MKDSIKRAFIVVVLLCVVLSVIIYFSKNYSGNEIAKNVVQQENNTVISKEPEPEIVELPTDEIELYNGEIAYCITNLNFRKEPSTESNIIETISKDSIINILAKLRNGWYKVSYNSNEGYVSGEYIHILTIEEKKEITVEQKYEDNTFAKVFIDSDLNIRQKANKNSLSLTRVKPNSVLKVFEKMENGWYKVEGNTITGYVSGEYIKILSPEEYKTYSSSQNNMLIPEKNIIAQYTTSSSYSQNSRANMHMAADYINGTVIAPGQTYSHLNVVHPVNEPNNYLVSSVFEDGEVVQGQGGGICMTSSTVYAAIAQAAEKGIYTGLNVTAREPHSRTVSYVPRKFEATVSSGSQDFCFRNCNDYSIKIEAIYNYNTLTVTFYKV